MAISNRTSMIVLAAILIPVSLACLGRSGRFSDEREICDALLDCAADGANPELELPGLTAAYGDDSACWDSSDAAELCAQACEAALDLRPECAPVNGGGDPLNPVGAWSATQIEFDDDFNDIETLPGTVDLGEVSFEGSISLTISAGGSGNLTTTGDYVFFDGSRDSANATANLTWATTSANSFSMDVASGTFVSTSYVCTSLAGNHRSIRCARGQRDVDYLGIDFAR